MPVPCISGQAGNADRRLAALVHRAHDLRDLRGIGRDGEARRRVAEGDEVRGEAALRVHHALRHAGRAAGEEHVDVVLTALDAGHRVVGDQVLVARCSVEVRAVVVDFHQQLELRESFAHPVHPVGERRVEEEGLRVGVVEEVPELVVEVAVVHVHRDAAELERTMLRLEVLVRVVEVQAHLRVGSEARVGERSGQPSGAAVVLGPRAPGVPMDQRRRVGHRVGDRFPHRGHVHLHGRASLHRRASGTLGEFPPHP